MLIRVKHNTKTVEVELPANATTLLDLKRKLQVEFRVPVTKQRIIFSGGKKVNHDQTNLKDVGIPEIPHTSAPTCMLIGVAEVSVLPDDEKERKDDDQREKELLPRLVGIERENSEGTFTCAYTEGYVSQNVFFCRSCAENGWGDKDHLICLSCAEICHDGHKIENWGPSLYARCDCCTSKFTHPGHTCRFIVDERTQNPPMPPFRLPANEKNRYPRDSMNWCYCKATSSTKRRNVSSPVVGSPSGPDGLPPARFPTTKVSNTASIEKAMEKKKVTPVNASDDNDDDDWEDIDDDEEEEQTEETKKMRKETKDDEDGEDGGVDDRGQSCLLCHQNFYGAHLTTVMTHPYKSTPCYGEIIKGEVVEYRCNTCDYNVCPPCRLRCHKDHDVSDVPILSHRQERQGEFIFSCGCGGMCSIADSVPDLMYDEMQRMPPNIVRDLLDEDSFVSFICSICVQENPWLMNGTCKLNHCYEGVLPAPNSMSLTSSTSSPPAMLPILPCGAFPAPEDIDNGKIFPVHGMLMPVGCFAPPFACGCDDCTVMYEKLCPGMTSKPKSVDLFIPKYHFCSNCSETIHSGFVCMTCEMTAAFGESYYLCEKCYEIRGTIHDPQHELVADTFDNLWRLFGASLAKFVDPQTQSWMVDHWENSREMMFEFLRGWLTKRVRDVDDEEEEDTKRT